MAVKKIETLAEFKEITAGDKVVFIDYYADWCGPCKMISPHFEKLAKENENIDFYKVNIDDVPDVAQEVQVRSIPLFHAWHKGERIDQLLGANIGALTTLVQKGVSVSSA